jgi:hypothetical protein
VRKREPRNIRHHCRRLRCRSATTGSRGGGACRTSRRPGRGAAAERGLEAVGSHALFRPKRGLPAIVSLCPHLWSQGPFRSGGAEDRSRVVVLAGRRHRTVLALSRPPVGAATSVAESWNGARWTALPTPSPPARLRASSQAPRASASTRAPRSTLRTSARAPRPLAERWTGAHWTIFPTPNPAGARTSSLVAVSCVGADDCRAVGEDTNGAGVSSLLTESG